LRESWPNAQLRRDDTMAEKIAAKIFAQPAKSRGPLRTFVKGTPFQVRVWRAMLRVPSGHLTSYGRLA
jgi:AraC family transcriptional regulator of adaptative response/methylated-DNA-[protein]-cysteine methyltransferase